MADRPAKTTTREEDYRDYEHRDLDQGWPYADEVSGQPTDPANRAYGEGAESFDEQGNPGFQTADEPRIDSANGPDLLADDVEGDVDDDAIEARLVERLEDKGVDLSAVEIRVEDGEALLSGAVETREDRRLIEQMALAQPGINTVRNELTTLAVDAAIPTDLD
ncbi:hypothetical protein BJF93_05445 [Xaviernesmea oryzae]|uniref:BON domain-containing protein n=1 Tax=Xaviernesmea oryzae TaxID=464029 RepID=A0A1Q9ARR8_9HYPH|nr:BON domain-containing protein [Xaviernesmea oryzae]OLP58078.1 hypothetical protein BJF93_05445 [Xaviernesmea oryzae]SEL83451.1 BON domain-containing protein [Xaviernesmea oryzae]